MGGRDYIDLLELQTRIKESIADAFPGRYWVKAEIASCSPRANGHCYLTLTQTRGGKSIAESRAMIWKWKYPQITQFFEAATGQRLQAGITVLVQVQVSFSELYGVSLFIEDVDPAFTPAGPFRSPGAGRAGSRFHHGSPGRGGGKGL